ncbi:hypothetical protein DdX_08790 [Ditylenchus destructor]|uniref:F-box domain-containing protein n=1 Tax=Ditylenchus destructor TaxID=166010 RepID=A0AAD4N1N5_9BILA|nr:hypothetical protein DdX_08790 [Ditylenchus destructor]
MPLYDYLILDTLAFCTRSELVKLSLVNRCFKTIVQGEFAHAPYIEILTLRCYTGPYYQNNGVSFEDKHLIQHHIGDIDYVAKAKYLRAKRTSLLNSAIRINVLQSISHVWMDAELRIDWNGFNITPEFVPLFSSCRSLQLVCFKSLSILRDLLTDNCECLNVDDYVYKCDEELLPADDMIAYLFSSAGKETPENNKFSKALCINMYGGKPLNVGQCQDIVQEIKKRFLEAETPVNFILKWRKSENERWSGFRLNNYRVEQSLNLFLTHNDPQVYVNLCTDALYE